MIGMTLCSGIGAPEVAAPWVDWRFASEIEPFPRAVLQERFGYKLPEAHNQGDPLLWGDMTEVTPDLLRSRGIPLPDLIVAGTPCQAFSVAGLRKGLDDARGNLTLAFVEICHAIVAARPNGKLAVLWENVPGVLSDSGNAFGCFLGGLVGAMDALPPPGNGSWPGEGMVEGPRARAAWAVLDAQWFGVAQRRRRVFVVVDFGNCIDPAAVLLEPDRLRGDSPPRREAGQNPAGTLAARTGAGGGLGTDFDLDGGLVPEISHCLNAGGMGRQDYETETFVAHALRAEGFDASEDGTGRWTPIVAVNARQDPIHAEDVSLPLDTDQGTIAIAFTAKDYGADAMTDCSPTLRSGGHAESHQNGGVMPAVTYAIQERAVAVNPTSGPGGAGFRDDGAAYTLEARSVPQAVAYDMRGRDGGAQFEGPHDTANLRAASGGSSRSYVQAQSVRRLMPVECERLQGFPDSHTAIMHRGKPAADGPRYKAIGNSMAVPVIRWIMERMRASMGAPTEN